MNKLLGLAFVGFIALVCMYLSGLDFFVKYAVSSLIIGIVFAMCLTNILPKNLLHPCEAGIKFSSKTLLRVGVVLYGFRLSLQGIYEIGLSGIVSSLLVVLSVFLLGIFVGVKILKMDKDLAILTSIGSAVCGAAAVLATEPVIKAKAYKSAIAISTVVLFGTIFMFLYPVIFKFDLTGFNASQFGIYLGSTLHEVAHVVGASNAISEEVAKSAIIVKMLRVIYLSFLLIILAYFMRNSEKQKIAFPSFALYFILVVVFNSFVHVGENILNLINHLDTFLLTMAMVALGLDSRFDKFKQAGFKPFLLAFILALWLIFAGYLLVKFAFYLA